MSEDMADIPGQKFRKMGIGENAMDFSSRGRVYELKSLVACAYSDCGKTINGGLAFVSQRSGNEIYCSEGCVTLNAILRSQSVSVDPVEIIYRSE